MTRFNPAIAQASTLSARSAFCRAGEGASVQAVANVAGVVGVVSVVVVGVVVMTRRPG